jgi:translation initiation factor 2 alpha subunit (eIF-2alpha)
MCIQCEELPKPCPTWQSICKDYEEQYGGLLSAMERVMAGGTDDWLAEMDARMRCPNCHGAICYFEEVCIRCGNQLT